ncbi:MAG: YfhO family protein, partial [Anaerolineae bacterium]|nr:YfhO family protein [Anaerolineae bacterium]
MFHRVRGDALAALLLLLIPVLWFAPVLTGRHTLLPADNLYAWEPWRSFAGRMGVDVPHNELLSDLILENYPWKHFIRENLRAHQIPLWNPYLFSGMPFLADAQHSALYPFSVLFWVMPLEMAYGWFTALQIALAGLSLYALARVLRLSRPAALVGAIAYMLSGFFMVSVVFTMMIAAAAWLPALLACIEVVIRKQEEKGNVPYSPVPYIALGSVILGVQVLAGHVEITYYVLVVAGFYAAWRLVGLWRRLGHWRPAVRLGVWLLAMVAVGLALGGVQLLPLVELAQRNFRQGSVTYRDVVGWAWPTRQVLTFVLPDVFGNPSHHAYWDIWSLRRVPVTVNALGQPIRTIFWGVKNYVEGGNYLGLLTMGLAGVALTGAGLARGRGAARRRDQTAFFTVLGLVSLANAFGTSLFALFYYGLPWYKQVHSPFRWVFPLTLSAAVLAALGADALWRAADEGRWLRRAARLIALGLFAAGAGALLAVGVSLVWP